MTRISRTYLLSVDEDRLSHDALASLERIVDPDNDHIIVFSVADDTMVLPYLMADERGVGGVDSNAIREKLSRNATDIVKSVKKQLNDRGFKHIQTETRFGKPGTEICDFGRDSNVHSIFVLRKTHGTLEKILIGSVSHYVVHHSETPVILIPSRGTNED